MREKVRMVCSQCGSEDVFADAYAGWNVGSQAWEIVETFAKGAYCNKCEGETRIKDRSIRSKRPPQEPGGEPLARSRLIMTEITKHESVGAA
jgi:hypothetical protein